MKLLLENWRQYLNEFNPTGRKEGEFYTKSLPLDNPDLEIYKKAIGQDIRGVAKVFDVQGGEIKMEYIVPYNNSKGSYDINNDARYEAIQCVGAGRGEECLSDKLETEETLNKIINYQIYEKIWNISNNGVKLKITEKENE